MDKSNLELFKQALNEGVSNKFDKLANSCTDEIVYSERHKLAMRAILYGKTDTKRVWSPKMKRIVAILVAAALLLTSCGIIFRNEIREIFEEFFVKLTYDGDNESTENIKDALDNLHIKINDLDKFGIEYSKTESNVDRIVFEGYGWNDSTEIIYADENYIYEFGVQLSYATNVYYKDGTSEKVKDALKSGRILITALEWHGMPYAYKVQKKNLTMETLYALVDKYGEDLSWRHFTRFRYIERGIDQHIWICPIDNNYQIWIGGDDTDTSPDYIYLVAQDGSGDHIDVRTESIDDFRYLKESVVDVPEDFSFSLNWGVEGISSYDSATGKLVKDNEAYYVAEFTTDYTFKALDIEYIYILLMDLNIDKYPDEYAPNINPTSPSEKIILTVRMGNKVKTVTVEAAAFFNDYSDRDATAFFYTCNTIAGMLESTDEWKALPDYDRFFE